MGDPSALLAKPVSTLREASEILACFGMLLGGLAPLPEMTVLDFGAGSCWTTHFLAQLGCHVIAMDISTAMLDLGRKRFDDHPLFGHRPAPTFSVFDGQRMELADESVDRILCFDALHHVADPASVVTEMGRVLRPGGVAGFSEPGPRHSVHPKSQHEMRRYGVPECDVVLDEIWRTASGAGFVDLSVAVFSPSPHWMAFETFERFLDAGAADARPESRGMRHRLDQVHRLGLALRPRSARVALRHVEFVRTGLQNRRMFLMRKAGSAAVDSREVVGLAGHLVLHDVEVERRGTTAFVRGTCVARNVGQNRWVSSSANLGAVRLGLRLRSGAHPARDVGRASLPGSGVEVGEEVAIVFELEVADAGPGDTLEVDLVSEGITWFSELQGQPLEVALG